MEIGKDKEPPKHFTWVIKREFATMGCPKSKNQLRYLWSKKIKYLVTLSPERKPPIDEYPKMKWAEIPIKELEPPTLAQVRKFIRICDYCHIKNIGIGVHCKQGKGRSGTIAACYLVRFYNMDPKDAIAQIRSRRPGSLETVEQENLVTQFKEYLIERAEVLNPDACYNDKD